MIISDIVKSDESITFRELNDKLNKILIELSQDPPIATNSYERGYWLGAMHMLNSIYTERIKLSDLIE